MNDKELPISQLLGDNSAMLPISHPLGDNSAAWQKFAAEDLGLSSSVGQTHLTAIGANNGQHKKHFKCMDVYEEFYDFVNCIIRCW